jgi:plastocyanin
MNGLRTGCAALFALAFVTGCGADSTSRELVAPGANGDAGFAADRRDNSGDDVSEASKIAIRDDCDPRDPAWDPTGGCLLRRGDVTFAEFNGELSSTLSASVVGHQAWRNDPTYLKVRTGKTVRVQNEGGRAHTFTEVAMFGGGKVPPLNQGLVVAPECPGSTNIDPGGSAEVSGLTVGNHRFQCCIHPWMRALIKVKAHDDHGDD